MATLAATAPPSAIAAGGDQKKQAPGPVRQKSNPDLKKVEMDKLAVKSEGDRATTPESSRGRAGAAKGAKKDTKHVQPPPGQMERRTSLGKNQPATPQDQNTAPAQPPAAAAPQAAAPLSPKAKRALAEKKRVVVKRSDMPPELQEFVINTAKEALAQFKIEKDMATHIKRALDNKFPNALWHCIVGKHFGATVTHETEYHIFFSIDEYHVMLFKSLD